MGRWGPLRLLAIAAAGALLLAGCTSERYWGGTNVAEEGKAKVGLVTKTDTNPYFVQLREAARKQAAEQDVEFSALAGRFDGDNAGQVTAIENLVQQGATTILITPNSSTGVLSAIEQARNKGIMVLALDTATEPEEAVDGTIATDNVEAGRKQGQYIKAALGETDPQVLLLNGTPGSSVDTQRRQGFLEGIGLKAGDSQILGEDSANGDQNMAQESAENLLQRASDVNAVYTMNEPTARGANAALRPRGLDPLVGSIDGGCQGVGDVQKGDVDATVMQFPAKMARLGVDAAVEHARSGKKISGFENTGSVVITDNPVPGVPSQNTEWGMRNCWGDS
ncbi:fructose transport system substrate-binding protein [Tamaricihabitans halophyticus]|uniref:Fructose transport system substrate-binding protein n=1 Tax=Tamaricihabitans halophyticus TaxID=1262583 RepID=A0A4R2R5Z1_9PSEU|nr:substrate-binding domain-containing protein [Tamaricihabitans halophyticus]TCP57218.1 fructose transport system substrate-binding protein [Tamaricihabitans halophyticus]